MNVVTTSLLDLDRDRNGVTTVALDLNRLLSEAGHCVRTLTPSTDRRSLPGRLAARVRQGARQVRGAPGASFFFLLGLVATTLAVGRRLSAWGGWGDAVVAHDVLSAGAALGSVKPGCPVLLLCHFWAEPWNEFVDAGLLTAESYSFRRLRRRMGQVFAEPRLTLVAVSERNASLVRTLAPGAEGRVHVVYPGVRRSQSRAGSGRERGGVPVVVNVGKVERRKNQRILPDVAAELARAGVACRFLLIGPQDEGEARFVLERAAALGVADRFTLAGSLERREVEGALGDADLYLHTSLQESFGMTLIEAMAAGTPVLALDYEALHEIVPGIPEAVIPSDATPAAIARRVAEVVGDPAAGEALRERQRAVYDRRFSSDTFLAHALEVLSLARERCR